MTYAAISGLLVVAVVAVAYGTAAPHLAVAEFAPAAQRNLEPPPTTGSEQHSGTAAARRGQRSTTTTAPVASGSTSEPGAGQQAATTRAARTRSCVGNPPRQTEDPLSPPCVATIFEGDNGGATTPGVSPTEIRVAVPAFSGFSTAAPYPDLVNAFFEYFNQRFELYGRRFVPVIVEGSATTPTAARAQAADIVGRNVFAAITSVVDWGAPHAALVQGLARERVVTVTRNTGAWWSDRLQFDALHPYAWSVYPSAEALLGNLADFSCSVLAGQPAAFAGDPALTGKTRRFGVIAGGDYGTPQIGILTEALTECAGASPLRFDWVSSSGTTAIDTGLARLRDGGATTVICVCADWSSPTGVMGSAGRLNFKPEWILNPTALRGDNEDEGWLQDLGPALNPPIRLTAGPRLLPLQARPWFGPLQSTRPGLAENASSAYSVWGMSAYIYEQLLILAAGVQGAGPMLTPDAFAAALMSTDFPNPGAGQPPYWQPSAGFGPGDHALYDDYTVGWWSTTADAVNYPVSSKPKGSWCYLHEGARYRPGGYPADAAQRLFNPNVPCR